MELKGKIETLFFKHRKRYGSPRILHREGIIVNQKRVARVMHQQGWRAKATTDSRHSLSVTPNRLNQNFSASQPNEKPYTHITYVWTNEGWLYLAVVLDIYSRKIIGWSQLHRMTRQLVIDALNMALWRRKIPAKAIVHSDLGSQYCSE